MSRIFASLLVVVLALSGCQPDSGRNPPIVDDTGKPPSGTHTNPGADSGTVGQTTTPAATNDQPAASDETPAADNSAINKRDRDSESKTPIDQDEDAPDLKITADIRKRVVAQPNFSIDAQNVKIITSKGQVTLRGPVKTQAERDEIQKIANDVAGQDNVENQLEITP